MVFELKAPGAGAARVEERIMARRRKGMLGSIFLLCLWGVGCFGGGCSVYRW